MSTKPTANIASGWLDIATFADLDKKLYDGEEVTVLHSKDINPVSFFTRLPVPLKKQGQASGATYTYAKSADFAENTWYTFTTPQIDVISTEQVNYRIAYSPNWGHHVVNSLQLTVNEIPIVKLDPVVMDQLSELNLKDADFTAYQRFIGNTNKALTFGHHLPQITVKKPLHELWFGQKTNPVPGNAFPLCCAKNNTLALAIEFVDSLAEVIRIQKNYAAVPGTDPADWRDFNPKSVNLADIVSVTGTSGLSMPLPDVWTEYVLVMDDERAMHQAKTIDTVIEQVQRFTSPRITVGTTRFTFHFSYPLRYLVFSAANATAADKNYFGNYSTNPLDASAGLDPVRQVTLWYDNTARWQNMGGDHFTDLEPLWHAARVPTAAHHLEPYCYSTVSSEIDGSSNYSKLATDLEVVISETSTDPSDPTTTPSEYKVEVSGLVNNLIRFEGGSLSFPSWSN